MTPLALLCAIAAAISFRNVKFGLCFLLLAKCIFVIPVERASISIGFGTLSGPDLVIFAILAKTVLGLRSRLINNKDIFPLTLFILSISFSVTVAVIFDNESAAALYRGIVENAFFYSIPVSMYLLGADDKKFVIRFALLTGFLSVVVLAVLLLKGNLAALTEFYPYYQDEETSTQLKEMLANSNGIPRILPSGILLILMGAAYSFAKLFLEKSLRLRVIFSGLFLFYTVFVASTGTRGYIVALVAMSMIFLFVTRHRFSSHRWAKHLVLFFVVLSGIAFALLQTKLGDNLIQRTAALHQQGYRDEGLLIRLKDNIDAVGIISESPIGIGVTRPLSSASGARAGMWDVNGFLTVGLLGGLPAMGLLLWFLVRVLVSYRRKCADDEIVACGTAVSMALILTFMNSTPAFISPQYILPFGVFSGYLLSCYLPGSQVPPLQTPAESVLAVEG